MAESALRATLLTPRGRGAVAVVRVWGSGATAAVDRLFTAAAGRSLATFAIERIVFGRWHGGAPSESEPGEELVVCRRAADDVEIHCHGGVASSAAIFTALEAAGATVVNWQKWAAEGCSDRVHPDAETALAEARTTKTAGILLDQLAGALGRALGEIIAALDRNEIDAAQRLISVLMLRAAVGRHLTVPYQVVLAGRPNVGKSSLINALVGYERSIVFDKPGTTRDVVTAAAVFDGWPIELSDTAGLRDSSDLLERAGMNAARRRLVAADLVVLVFDAAEPWTTDDDALCAENPTAVVVHNKIDRLTESERTQLGTDRPYGLAISAATNLGLDVLIGAIASRLVPHPPQPGEAVPFNERQEFLIARAASALASGNVDKARLAISVIISP